MDQLTTGHATRCGFLTYTAVLHLLLVSWTQVFRDTVSCHRRNGGEGRKSSAILRAFGHAWYCLIVVVPTLKNADTNLPRKKNRSSLTVGLPWFTTLAKVCEFRCQRLPFDSTSGFQCWCWVVQIATSRVPRRTPFGWQWNLQKVGFCRPQCTFDVPNYHGCNHTYRLRQYVVDIPD